MPDPSRSTAQDDTHAPRRTQVRSVVVFLLIVTLLPRLARAQTTQPLQPGTHDLFFAQRSALSAIEIQHARYGIPAGPEQVYDIAQERFSVTVPPSYDPEALDQWGILVWCNAGKAAQPPKDWAPVLDQKKLLALGAFNVGNDRAVAIRVGLAIDAAVNLRQRYPNLAAKRVYAAGVSGGAKVATMAVMGWPEVFDGAICCAGVNWYKDTPVPDMPGKLYPATFHRPPLPVFTDARDHLGFALTTGPNDGNYQPVKAIYETGFLPDGFKYARLFDVPALGHQPAPADTFAQAIDYLDGIPKAREKKFPTTTTATATTRTAEPIAKAPIPASPSSEPSGAARLLSLAKNYRANNMAEKARAKLEELLKNYPNTEEAKVARTMLRDLAAGQNPLP